MKLMGLRIRRFENWIIRSLDNLRIRDLSFGKLRKNDLISNLQTPTSEKGQSLLEVLAAVGVAILVIVGLSTLTVYGLKNAQRAKNRETATRLAGQGIEHARTVRDRNGWPAFVQDYPTGRCYKAVTGNWILVPLNSCNTSDAESFANPDFEIFSRQIKLESANVDIDGDGDVDAFDGENGRKITVTVFWTDATGVNQVSTNTILTQWR